MKKFFTLMTLLVALCSGAWAATNTLYERGNVTAWSSADATAWGNGTIDGGLIQTGTNAGWEASLALTPTPFAKVTMTAVANMGDAPGRDSSYDFIKLGNIEVHVNGQNRVAQVFVEGVAQGSTVAATRGASYIFTVEINTATGAATYSVSGGANIPSNTVSGASASITDVKVGHFRGGRENYASTVKLTAINIVEETQAIPTADYTVNYKCGGKVVKKETGSIAVGQTVNASAPFNVNGMKYYFADGATTSITIASGTNVLDVNLREAKVYNYTAKSQFGDLLYSGRGFEEDLAYYYYPKYFQKDGKLYFNNGDAKLFFQGSMTLDADNKSTEIVYSESTANCAYYSEAELIEGITSYEDGYVNTRMSNGAVGYATKENTVITTLPAGVYTLESSTRSAKDGIKFYIGGVEVLNLTSDGAVVVSKAENIILTEPANLTVSVGSKSHYFDYILIEKVADYVPATGVEVSTETPTIALNKNATLFAKVLPADATVTDVKWESSNNNIATVDQSGVVTPITSGTVTIYATDHLGHSSSQVITITPLKALVSIKDAPSADAKVIVGATKESKDQAADGEYVNVTSRAGWEGLVSTTQLNHEGSVWATEYNTSVYEILVEDLLGNENTNKIIKCIYTPDIQVEEMVMDTKSQLLVEGGSRVTGVSYFPADATFKTAKWSSSDESIAIVDAETGKVTAVGAGTCTITAAWSANAEHGTDISTSYTLTVFPKHSYDFFCWSDETMADVKADPMWVSTDEGKSYGSNFRNYSKTPAFLTANGKEIEELYGIKFLYPVEGQIGIAVNKGKNGENNYNGTQYLALNGLAAQMIIKNVKCGTQVVIGMESQYNEDYSQVQLDVNGKMVTPVRIHEKEFAEYKWTVPGTAADGVVDVVVRNYTSIGANIYYINCDVDHSLPLSLPTAVETVKTTTETPAKILTKTGIKVKGYDVDGK